MENCDVIQCRFLIKQNNKIIIIKQTVAEAALMIFKECAVVANHIQRTTSNLLWSPEGAWLYTHMTEFQEVSSVFKPCAEPELWWLVTDTLQSSRPQNNSTTGKVCQSRNSKYDLRVILPILRFFFVPEFICQSLSPIYTPFWSQLWRKAPRFPSHLC